MEISIIVSPKTLLKAAQLHNSNFNNTGRSFKHYCWLYRFIFKDNETWWVKTPFTYKKTFIVNFFVQWINTHSSGWTMSLSLTLCVDSFSLFLSPLCSLERSIYTLLVGQCACHIKCWLILFLSVSPLLSALFIREITHKPITYFMSWIMLISSPACVKCLLFT